MSLSHNKRNMIFSYIQGPRQKNFKGRGGNGKDDRKVAKKDRKIELQASIYYICAMYENPGGPRPPVADADAHVYIARKVLFCKIKFPLS